MISNLALAALVAVMPAQSRECAHEAERSATLAAAAGDRLRLVARSGTLRVEGRSGLNEVRVRAHACASSADLLERLTLETGKSGSEIRVEAAEVDMDWQGIGRRYARLDMVLEIPAGMDATIHDGSGAAEISGTGALDLTDGSGEVMLSDVRGRLVLRDGSGEVTIDNVNGDVDIVDGSGELTVTRVTGSVTIRDGSGSIDVQDVSGNFTVSAGGSGSIRHSEVRGTVSLPERRKRR